VVRVWLVTDEWPGAVPDRQLAELEAVLDADERRRAAACRSAAARRRFVLAHAAARHIAARWLGAPADGIRWERGPHGKPRLAGRWTGAQLNLSHSGELALVALTTARPVGVDVQRVLPHLDTGAMARRYFPSREAESVAAEPDPVRRAEHFARLWARKEALVKAYGGRLTQGLRVPVHDLGTAALGPYHPDRPGAGCPAVPDGADGWACGHRITDLPAPPGYRAAVALAGAAPYRVRWHTWAPPGAVRAHPTGTQHPIHPSGGPECPSTPSSRPSASSVPGTASRRSTS
jgi:4'-phosphopantetheinyl transferase